MSNRVSSIKATKPAQQRTSYFSTDERLTKEVALFFPRQGEWTEEDYLALPETNCFVELSDGRLEILEMPTNLHQYTVGELFVMMRAFVRENALGQVRVAPLPVRLWEGKFREPDLIFMSTAHIDRIEEDFWGVPDLVVEVHSKGTIRTDRVKKFGEYAQAGVAEYWLVNLRRKTIEVYVLRQGRYTLLGKWGVGEVTRSEVLVGFEVAVEAVTRLEM